VLIWVSLVTQPLRGAATPAHASWTVPQNSGLLSVTASGNTVSTALPGRRGTAGQVGPAASPFAGATIDAPAQVPAPTARELWQIFGVWTFVAILTSANGLMEPRGRGLQPLLPAAPVALAFVQCYLWAIVTPLVFYMCSRYTVERNNWARRFALYAVTGVAVANLVSLIIDFMRFEVLYAPRTPPPGRAPFELNAFVGITRMWWLDDLIVFVAVLAVGFARDYFLRFQLRRDETTQLQTHAAQLQAQLVEARLSALRSQLNPHFLFNTLNAVSALVERDPRGVRRMIARLSELLRYSLNDGNEAEVALSRELTFIDRYVEIMQIRFEGRLDIRKDAGDDVLDALVPTFVLQTLVENALKYGVDQSDGTGRIEISARREGERLMLRVRDYGPGLKSVADVATIPHDDNGLGIRNTRARLQQLYGTDQSLSLLPATGGGVIAEVTLPFHVMADMFATGEMQIP
jgi:two-component system LytT family sensor kinase